MCQDLYQNTKESSKARRTSRNCKIRVMQQQSCDGGHRIRAPRHGITCCWQCSTITITITMYYCIVYHAMCAPRQGITCCRQVWGAGRVGKGVARDARREACTRIPAQVPVTRVGIWDGICTNGCLYGHTTAGIILCCAIKSKVASGISFILMSPYWQLR